MKIYITSLLLILSMATYAQSYLDTIRANEQKNVALFFPRPIRQAITGAPHFVFTYNREKEQYFGLLQASQGIESNLLVVTDDGSVYSFLLKYAKELPVLNRFINEGESIGNEIPRIKVVGGEDAARFPIDGEKSNYYRRAGDYLLNLPQTSISAKRKRGIKLELEKMVYNGPETYLLLEIRNSSGIDFEVDYLNIYIVNGDKKRKSSFQNLLQPILYTHKLPKLIFNGQACRFQLVLPKFVLGENEKLMLELKERNGSRKVVMETNPRKVM